MKLFIPISFVFVLLTGCVATNLAETGRFPTPTELKSQVAADGCLAVAANGVAGPVIAATTDGAGVAVDTLAAGAAQRLCDTAPAPAK